VKPDLVLTEGYRGGLYPKIEVLRVAQGLDPMCSKEDQLIALVSDGVWDLGVPRFELEATDAILDFLIDEFLLRT
jgi:molybdopterin-guanine dinucleotide biosynthesis protein B